MGTSLLKSDTSILSKALAKKVFDIVSESNYDSSLLYNFSNDLKALLKQDPSLYEEILLEMHSVYEMELQKLIIKHDERD